MYDGRLPGACEWCSPAVSSVGQIVIYLVRKRMLLDEVTLAWLGSMQHRARWPPEHIALFDLEKPLIQVERGEKAAQLRRGGQSGIQRARRGGLSKPMDSCTRLRRTWRTVDRGVWLSSRPGWVKTATTMHSISVSERRQGVCPRVNYAVFLCDWRIIDNRR